MKTQTRVTNNFNNEVFYTSSTGQDLKAEIRSEARKQGKQVTDFKIQKA
jgi:tripartite-type tricarboxylate transporter receptor subunit TctC